jgi:hypothetical protein
MYGSRYKSLHYFASIHNDAGGNSVCDEFHGGSGEHSRFLSFLSVWSKHIWYAGFANNHLMLGNYLEQSLQLIDPTTCLHYMDYTKYFENSTFLERKCSLYPQVPSGDSEF